MLAKKCFFKDKYVFFIAVTSVTIMGKTYVCCLLRTRWTLCLTVSLLIAGAFASPARAHTRAQEDSLSAALSTNTAQVWSLRETDPDAAQRLVPELLALAEGSASDAAIGKAYYAAAQALEPQGEFDQVLTYYQRAARHFERAAADTALANCLWDAGIWCDRNGRFAEGMHLSERALGQFSALGDTAGIVSVLNTLGIGCNNLGRYDQALAYYQNALHLATQIRDTLALARTQYNLGVTRKKQEDASQAFAHFRTAAELVRQLGNERGLGRILTEIGHLHQAQGQLDSARYYHQQALAIKTATQDTYGLIYSYNNLGELYLRSREWARSLEAHRMALGLCQPDDLPNLAYTHWCLGQVHRNAGQLAATEAAYQQSWQMAGQIGSYERLRDAAEGLAQTYARRGNFRSAYAYQQYFKQYADSLKNDELSQEIGRLDARYEYEGQLRNLQSEQQQREQTQAQQLLHTRWLAAFFLLAFVSAGGLAAVIYRSRARQQAAAQQLAAQKEALALQAQALAASNQVKDRLFSIIAHDLRSPINSLKGLLMLHKQGGLTPEELRTLMGSLTQNVEYTSGFLDNLLQWARRQMNGERIRPQRFNLNQLLDEKARLGRPACATKNLTLVWTSGPAVWAYADRDMIDLVVRNLLENACKFTPAGGTITLTLDTMDQQARVGVADTGLGMPPERLAQLFAGTLRPDRGTQSEKGTGLGLVVCHDFVEKNGGRLWAESTLGQGSQFYFSVPLATAASLPTPQRQGADCTG